MLILIAALDQNRIIAEDGRIPWRIPSDLRHFQRTTWGHPVVMGRKTSHAIGKTLPGRTNLIVTRISEPYAVGAWTYVGVLERMLEIAPQCPGGEKVFVIGGGEIYKQTIDRADALILTVVHRPIEDAVANNGQERVHFPVPSALRWQTLTERGPIQEPGDQYPYRLLVLERKHGEG